MYKVLKQLTLAALLVAPLAVSAEAAGAKAKRFLATIYLDQKTAPQYGTPEFGPYMAAYGAATARYQADKAYGGGDALQPPETGKLVRVRNGKTETVDGAYGQGAEKLGGYYIFECEDIAKAVEYAALIPDAQYGTVEVRPIMVFEQ